MESQNNSDSVLEENVATHVDTSVDSNEGDTDEPMLSALEARILGALMEKQLTTPDTYPLSLNSLVLACNQKTSREPVMALNEGDVQHCLYQLQDRELIEIEYASRANKFKQKLTRVLHFDTAKQAILCLMLLRGPQTINELLSRSKRMHDFQSAAEVEDLLDSLLSKLKPLICKIPHQAGQREDRYTHLLCGAVDLTTVATTTKRQESSVTRDELVARVEELEKQVSWLMEKVSS